MPFEHDAEPVGIGIDVRVVAGLVFVDHRVAVFCGFTLIGQCAVFSFHVGHRICYQVGQLRRLLDAGVTGIIYPQPAGAPRFRFHEYNAICRTVTVDCGRCSVFENGDAFDV